jgi:hypothetical protein
MPSAKRLGWGQFLEDRVLSHFVTDVTAGEIEPPCRLGLYAPGIGERANQQLAFEPLEGLAQVDRLR